jgi:hypothetical protein
MKSAVSTDEDYEYLARTFVESHGGDRDRAWTRAESHRAGAVLAYARDIRKGAPAAELEEARSMAAHWGRLAYAVRKLGL